MRRPLALAAAVSVWLLTVYAAADNDPLPRATPESVGLSSVRLREASSLLNQ